MKMIVSQAVNKASLEERAGRARGGRHSAFANFGKTILLLRE
jgi:hypothetical protein